MESSSGGAEEAVRRQASKSGGCGGGEERATRGDERMSGEIKGSSGGEVLRDVCG